MSILPFLLAGLLTSPAAAQPRKNVLETINDALRSDHPPRDLRERVKVKHFRAAGAKCEIWSDHTHFSIRLERLDPQSLRRRFPNAINLFVERVHLRGANRAGQNDIAVAHEAKRSARAAQPQVRSP